jgi:hypothetical protein
MHIQRRYRGYRVRRKVADAAVMANISWYMFSLVCSLLLLRTKLFLSLSNSQISASPSCCPHVGGGEMQVECSGCSDSATEY